MQPDEVRTTLETCEFFKGLDRSQLAGIIADGQVMLERAVSVGPRKGTVPVAVLGKGKIIGGWSTLLNEPHTLMLSAVCRRPAALLAINGAELRQHMTADILLGFRLLEKLCLLLRDRVQATLGAMDNI